MAYGKGPPLSATSADDARWRAQQYYGGPIRENAPQMTQADVEREAMLAAAQAQRDRATREASARADREEERFRRQAVAAAIQGDRGMPFGVAAGLAGAAGLASALGQSVGVGLQGGLGQASRFNIYSDRPEPRLMPSEVYSIGIYAADIITREASAILNRALVPSEPPEPPAPDVPRVREVDLEPAGEIKVPVIAAREIEL